MSATDEGIQLLVDLQRSLDECMSLIDDEGSKLVAGTVGGVGLAVLGQMIAVNARLERIEALLIDSRGS